MTPPAFTLYRLYGHDASLLYVGATAHLAVRMSSHARRSAWWALVDPDRTRIQTYPTTGQLAAAELAAWLTEGPLHNRARPCYVGPLGWTPRHDPAWIQTLTPANRVIAALARCHEHWPGVPGFTRDEVMRRAVSTITPKGARRGAGAVLRTALNALADDPTSAVIRCEGEWSTRYALAPLTDQS